jgi:hypothetical protein
MINWLARGTFFFKSIIIYIIMLLEWKICDAYFFSIFNITLVKRNPKEINDGKL